MTMQNLKKRIAAIEKRNATRTGEDLTPSLELIFDLLEKSPEFKIKHPTLHTSTTYESLAASLIERINAGTATEYEMDYLGAMPKTSITVLEILGVFELLSDKSGRRVHTVRQ